MNTNILDNIYGITAIDGVPMVSSRKVAEVFEKQHKNILRDIDKLLKDLGELKSELSYFIRSFYKTSQNKKEPEYLITKDGFTLLAMGFTGNKALKFKIDYINRFNGMERFIFNRNIARLEYPELTSMIKLMHSQPKFYHFSNEADLINKIVTGMSSKQLHEKYEIAKGESIRDYLPTWQIEAIQRLQKLDVGLVVAIPDFNDRKKALQSYFDKLNDILVLPKLSA